MPSIAVTRTDIPHTNFGDITLVMDKSTIDPQENRKNTVYSADAWTPTVPRLSYKPRERNLQHKIKKSEAKEHPRRPIRRQHSCFWLCFILV